MMGMIYCIALISIIILAAGCGSKGATTKAEGIVDSLVKGDYAAVTSSFDATMKSSMSEAQLGQTWTALTTQAGAFKSKTGTRTEKEQGMDIVYVTCQFERANLDIKLVFDNSNQISGMWIVPTLPGK